METISRYTPWESKCLVQAIVVKVLLNRRRIKSALYLGVAKTGQGGLAAHAWLCAGGSVVTGDDCGAEFTVVAKFAKPGEEALE